MRSRHLAWVAVCLLSVYGCGGSSPGSTDAGTDVPKDTGKDTPVDKPADAGTDGKVDAGDAKDAPDADAADVKDAADAGDAKDASDGPVDVGGAPPCAVASQCPGQDSECAHRTCTAGVCGMANDMVGKILATQIIGDCKVRQCGANGQVANVNDDKDIPDDINPCTKDACSGGTATHTPVAKDTGCGGGKLCNATGQCVGCTTAANCPGTDNACRTRTCTQGICGVTFKAAGTMLIDSTTGDCKAQQCDDRGTIQTVTNTADLPVDNNQCTVDQCNGSTPNNSPVARNTPCGTGQVCDGASRCVTCLTAASCPGSDDECQTRTCISGSCGVAYAAVGKAVANQVPADCQKNVCDGHGGVTTVADSTDPLVDNNPCTSDTCVGKTPKNPNLPARMTCGANLQCDGSGNCVTCLTIADCPGTDTECKHRTCNGGQCGVAFTAPGTPVSTQTSGDCKESQCDGNGAVTIVAKDSDKPEDNDPCTTDLCSNGTPSHGFSPSKTSCGMAGGPVIECDGNGNCVGCVMASECGTDNLCLTNVCMNGTCKKNFVASGTMVGPQVDKDCSKNVCNGTGTIVPAVDDGDLPVDGNQCTADLCMNGVASNPALPATTTMCMQNGGIMCDGAKNCVQCISPADCPGMDTDCNTRTCVNGVCGAIHDPVTKMLGGQTTGDCHVRACDGNGAVVSNIDDNDKPVDGNDCTDDVCTAGVKSNPNFDPGHTCQNGGTMCDGAGACVQCNAASDCPGSDTECATRTCVMHKCDVSFAPATKKLMSQIPGDCKDKTCDGNGNPTGTQFNNADVVVDGNACVVHTCSNGADMPTNKDAGTPCGTNGMCDGNGSCVGCLDNSDCNQTDTECEKHVCELTNHTCVASHVSTTHILMTDQTDFDCKTWRCDGKGGKEQVADPADLPNDMNPCTTDTCGGVSMDTPTHAPVAASTRCSPLDQPKLVCDGNNNCIGCAVASDCGTDSSDGCLKFTCSNNVCGTTLRGDGVDADAGAQTANNCFKVVCNGLGGNRPVVDPTDPPTDEGNACTTEECSMAGDLLHTPATGMACNTNGGVLCSATATCVTCLTDANCPASSDCRTYSCNAQGSCDHTDLGAGTPTATGQTAHDCKKQACDGLGNVTSQDDDMDVVDDGTVCTVDTCSGGMAISTNAAMGTVCTDHGGRRCTAGGTCVGAFAVVRMGDGAATLPTSGTSATTFVEVRSIADGTKLNSDVNLTTFSGATPFSISASAGSEGALVLSGDGHSVTMAGYKVAANTMNANTGTTRLAARVNSSGAVDLSAIFPAGSFAFLANNVRSAVTDNGTTTWFGGAATPSTNGGIWAVLSDTTGPQLVPVPNTGNPSNVRVCEIYKSQLYCTGNGSGFQNVFKVGTGLPTSGAPAAVPLSGLPITGGASPYAFAFLDLVAGDNTDPDTLYLTDDRAPNGGVTAGAQNCTGGGIQKWTSDVAGNWTCSGTFQTVTQTGTAVGVRGLAVDYSGGNVTLIATTTSNSPNTVNKCTDTKIAAPSTLPCSSLVPAPTNELFRGAALAPLP